MFKTLVLRLEGFGYLQSIRQSQGTIVAKIKAANAEQKLQKMHCADECTFECCVPGKLEKLFDCLRESISKGQAVMLSFLANYKDCYICNCCAKNDPDRILYFYAELDKVGCIYINGIKYSANDLLK
jgi:hypothetical protein